MRVFRGCGGYYTNTSGILTSPSYPNPYPYNAECDYVISQPNGTCINLTINHFETEVVAGSCSLDYLDIEEGTSASPLIIGKYCGRIIGRDIPISIHSSQNFVRLR